MAAEPVDLRPETAKAVAGFLAAHLPRLDDGTGWDHIFSTAYQIGCEALSALGYADEAVRGALRREHPALPDVLPRWDDLAVAVLRLAHQQNRLSYLRHDGKVEPRRVGKWTVVPANPPPPPVPNIAPAHGLGPALAAQDTLDGLGQLGLLQAGAWTAAAETVLWRCQPQEWGMTIEPDPRFQAGVARALDTLPDPMRAEIEKLASIPDADLRDEAARQATNLDLLARRPQVQTRPPPDPMDIARRAVPWHRQHALDWLFFRGWRLADGCLTEAETRRALQIFHDPLAIATRRAVIRHLRPDSPVAEC